MTRLASERKIFDAADLTPQQRRGAQVKTRCVKFRHVDEEIPVRTVVLADGSSGPSFVEFTDGLIEWTEFSRLLT